MPGLFLNDQPKGKRGPFDMPTDGTGVKEQEDR